MIAAENQSSLRAGSRLGQYEELAGDGSVGGGSEGGGGPATTTSEPGERDNYLGEIAITVRRTTHTRSEIFQLDTSAKERRRAPPARNNCPTLLRNDD